MNGFQKAIKYIALAFALFLSVTIIASCALAVLKAAVGINIITDGEWFKGGNIVSIDKNNGVKVDVDVDNIEAEVDRIVVEIEKIGEELGDDEMFGSTETQSFVKEFTAEEAARVRKLSINNYSAKLKVVQGTQLRVDAKDVSLQNSRRLSLRFRQAWSLRIQISTSVPVRQIFRSLPQRIFTLIPVRAERT